jgi:hypothetical protein
VLFASNKNKSTPGRVIQIVMCHSKKKFMNQPESTDLKNYSFEEFKLMYDSAEKVTDRRIALNKFNYSICTAIFLAIAFLWNWSLTNTEYNYAGIFIVMILSIIASVFTFYWIRQIKDYKSLNNAKFKVINQMSTNLFFPNESSDIKIDSFEPFTREWEVLKQLSALQEEKRFKIIALKSSNLEYFIPKAFRIIFLTLSILSLLGVVLNFGDFIDSIKGILLLK